ncbi:hypothetical protein ABW19_dt0207275 [Dactylella cylindrospora]|nr:hypothetical protein ABW19_dt0207275 [Dactylella cylindrospora]
MPNLLDLPAELRNQIYSYLLSPYSNRRALGSGYYEYNYAPSLVVYRLNRQIYLESRKIFHNLNTFVKISTPWEQAKHHVALDGLVNIVCQDSRADVFGSQALSVIIEAVNPPVDELYPRLHHFVILLETGDLDKFCTSWYYSSISMPYLNAHLSLTLKLQDPYTSASPFTSQSPTASEPHLPKQKQSPLLLPFGKIKDLRSFHLSHPTLQIYPSLLTTLKKTMTTPHDPPELCLQRATSLKDLGNAELTAGRYLSAVEYYDKAFAAVHIVITGRHRRVYGDQLFDTVIHSPDSPFHGLHAGTARIILRVRLVANTVLAYLKLKDYDMAIHTGMRTIRIMRASIGLDEDEGATDPNLEAMSGFTAAGEMGKIYFRTGMAYKEVEEKGEARRLLKVAAVYLPHDKTVRQELAGVALRLG